jgi:acetyl-CoA acetyltransferase
MSQKVCVAGVGMTPFKKPKESESYLVMAEAAIRAALKDAGVEYKAIQQGYAGYVMGDSTCGQAAAYRVGLTGIPIFNVNNNCASGSTALYLARQAVQSGAVDCALAFGFEQMPAGALENVFTDRIPPLQRFMDSAKEYPGLEKAPKNLPIVGLLFGAQYLELKNRYGYSQETFAKVTVKARQHAANNPFSIFREQVTVDEVLSSPPLFDGLTRLMACPPSCGAGAAIICSEKFAREHGLDSSVKIVAQAMTTDYESTFDSGNALKLLGADMTAEAAKMVYEESGVGPEDVGVIELHDCFTCNEIATYEALGLVAEGGSEQFINDGDNTYGGKIVVCPSGGLLSKGHPLGATGLAQCTELTQQLRGQSGKRQVDGVRTALQHNGGLGGATIVTMYQTN